MVETHKKAAIVRCVGPSSALSRDTLDFSLQNIVSPTVVALSATPQLSSVVCETTKYKLQYTAKSLLTSEQAEYVQIHIKYSTSHAFVMYIVPFYMRVHRAFR